jgi:hypothetical protein
VYSHAGLIEEAEDTPSPCEQGSESTIVEDTPPDTPLEGTELDLTTYGDDEDSGNYEGPTQIVSTERYI